MNSLPPNFLLSAGPATMRLSASFANPAGGMPAMTAADLTSRSLLRTELPSTLVARRSTGFTLIELLVVISIIAILAALALPAMNGAIQTARKSEVRAMANQIKLAVSTYYAEYGTYPAATNSGPDFLNAMSGATNITAIPNRRGIRFLEVPAKYSNALGVVTPAGFYKEKNDRRVFNIHADTNYDGRLEFNPGPGQTNMPGSVAVWVADPTQTNKTIGTW